MIYEVTSRQPGDLTDCHPGASCLPRNKPRPIVSLTQLQGREKMEARVYIFRCIHFQNVQILDIIFFVFSISIFFRLSKGARTQINTPRPTTVNATGVKTLRLSVCADEFNVYSREAGSGNVSVSIEGPSKAKIEMVDRKCGYVTVGYVVSKPGNKQ